MFTANDNIKKPSFKSPLRNFEQTPDVYNLNDDNEIDNEDTVPVNVLKTNLLSQELSSQIK